MKNYFTIIIIFLISFLKLNAQELKSEVYTGFLNEKTPITLYLQENENPCNGTIYYEGMYKYDGVSSWLQLNITQNEKKQFVLVEYGFTGVLILQKESQGFTGIWISPDSKKQFKIILEQVVEPTKEMESFDDTFEEVNYQNNDC